MDTEDFWIKPYLELILTKSIYYRFHLDYLSEIFATYKKKKS